MWLSLDHFDLNKTTMRLRNIIVDMNNKLSKAEIKRRNFISAEGPYSTLFFGLNNVSILIAGRMMNDKSSRPVIYSVSVSCNISMSSVSSYDVFM
jgi:hypothetical protein